MPFLTTGLVSLNVHEALTFDAEIVLHPDLFGGDGGGAPAVGGIGAGTAGAGGSVVPPPPPPTTLGGSSSFSTVVAGTTSRPGSQQRVLPVIGTSGSSEDRLTAASTVAAAGVLNPTRRRKLQVGDFIEIKVWDPLPRGGTKNNASLSSSVSPDVTARSSVASVMRRRSSPPTSLTQGSLASAARWKPQPPQHAAAAASGQSSTSSLPKGRNLASPDGPSAAPTNSAASLLKQAASTLQQQLNRAATAQGAAASPSSSVPPDESAQGPSVAEGGTGPAEPHDDEDGSAVTTTSGDRTHSVHNAYGASATASAATTPMVSPKSCLTDDPSGSAKQTPPSSSQPPLPTTTSSSTDALPPVFPRNLLSQTPQHNSEGQPVPSSVAAPSTGAAAAALPPKPPALSAASRRNTIGNPPFTSAADPTLATASAAVVAPSSASKAVMGTGTSLVAATTPSRAPIAGTSSVPSTALRPRHFRDLSDMTIDTVYDSKATSTVLLEGTHQVTGELRVPAVTAPGAVTGNAFGARDYAAMTTATTEDDEEDDEEDGTAYSHLSSTHSERLSFVMKVGEQSLTSLKGSARTQVSLLRAVADLYGLSSYDTVTIRRVDPTDEKERLASHRADFVLVTIKDQFISRGEMHSFLQDTLIGSWVYEGQRLFEASRNIQAHARQIRHQDLKVPSGIITDETKITFRSRSARFVWLVQMSSEMWDYSSPYERNRDESKCETYFDKWISFVRRLFDKWKDLEVTHSLTVVYFSRTFIGESPPIWYASSQRRNASPMKDHDIYGRQFEDHFRIVIENETSSDWDSVVVRLKEAFVRYPCEVGWNLASGSDARRPSTASQGNVMEAINVTLNLLAYHYLDRDLHRTGNSVVIISAGNGVFEVDKGLAAITYERMMVNGIGSDMLSLALPPLHTAPFFLYVNDRSSGGSLDFGGTYYEVPHWMHLSFVNYDSEERFVAVDVTPQPKRPTPCVLEIDGRPVLANGFLLPRPVDQRVVAASDNSPLIRPAGVAPTSPVKQTKIVSQERQLIAGRDFNDILEACRPRNASMLPSSLRALLRIYHLPESIPSVQDDDKPDSTDDLPEWGSIDHDSSTDSPSRQSHHRRVVALGQEPGVDLSPGFGPLPAPESPLDGEQVEKESVASSYASQRSSGIGVAYDRPFVNNNSSPTLAGVQVQKSASLDFLLDDKVDSSPESDNDSSPSSTDSSSSFAMKRANRLHRRNERFAARLKKQMRQHDMTSLVVEAPKPSIASDDAKTLANVSYGSSSQSSRSLQRGGKQPGGIGAALSQYRPGKSGSSIPETFEGPSSVSRVASTTKLTTMSNLKMQIPDMGSKGMSPLILPPVTLSSSEIPTSTTRRIPIEQRLVHRTDFSRSGFESLSRGTGKTVSSSLSRSPPLASSPGLAMSMMSSSSAHGQRPLSSRISTYQSKLRKSRHKKAFNPFRQEDEEEVLAKKSHNRRRWSHVFPLGEVEFKRHAGPNWKSLSSPAILPLFVDYFPSQQEVDHNFTFNYYNITLREFENSPYSSNQDFLMEMVRQRLTQDYQLVPLSHVDASNYRRESMSRTVSAAASSADATAVTRQFLSMGHRLQVLTYDHSADVIEVTIYDAKTTRESSGANSFMYRYHCFCQETQSYARVVQTFEKYADPYNWNKVDRIICGDEQRELREGMRFKRLMFVVIPDRFQNHAEEMQLVSKFQRLLEYLNKLRDRGEDSRDQLTVKIVTSADRQQNPSARVASTVGVEGGMKRFYVRLRKGKLDKLEWMEIVVDATFDTLWSYRIMFHWLVAGSAKVETQVQLLQRRCSQFGLTLVPIPQSSVSESIYVRPFKAPAVITIRDPQKVARLDAILAELGFLHDGVFYTHARVVAAECLDDGDDFDFGKRWSRATAGRQFLHRSGTLFVRIITDVHGYALVVALGNYLYMSKDPKLRVVAQNVYHQLSGRIDALSKPSTTSETEPSLPKSSSFVDSQR